MRIVHICLAGGYTEGMNYQENYLTKYHALSGHKVIIIARQYCWKKGVWSFCNDTNYYNEYGVKVIRIPYKFPKLCKFNTYIGKFKGLSVLLEELVPDFIFVHNFQFQDIKLVAKYKREHKNVRVVVDNHSDFSNSARTIISRIFLYKVYWKQIAQTIKNEAEKFYGVLPARVDFIKNIYRLPEEKCELLLMGADDEEVERVYEKQVRNDIRTLYNIQPTDFLIVTGGKIDVFKVQTLLLMEAIQNINKAEVKLIVFGSVVEAIRNKFDMLVDGVKIQYAGWVEGNRSYDFFAAADLVIFPGRHSVFWEQVAGLGIPMICKYWNGTTHIDVGGNVEFLYKDSANEIYEKILEIVDRTEKYRIMKEAAEKGMKEFSYLRIAERCFQ